jgi:hypothetical protein
MRKIIPVELGGYKILFDGDKCENYGRLVGDPVAKRAVLRKSDKGDGEDLNHVFEGGLCVLLQSNWGLL